MNVSYFIVVGTNDNMKKNPQNNTSLVACLLACLFACLLACLLEPSVALSLPAFSSYSLPPLSLLTELNSCLLVSSPVNSNQNPTCWCLICLFQGCGPFTNVPQMLFWLFEATPFCSHRSFCCQEHSEYLHSGKVTGPSKSQLSATIS